MTFALFSDLDPAHTPTDGSFPVSTIHPGTTVITFTATAPVTIQSIAAQKGQNVAQFAILFASSLPVSLVNGGVFRVSITYTPSGSGVPEYLHFLLNTNQGPMDIRIQGLPA